MLLEELFRTSGSVNGARPVELTVVVQSEVRLWRFPPIGDFLYGECSATSSKSVAPRWTLTQLPPEYRPVLEHAKELYLCRRYSEETWRDELQAKARPYVDYVVAEIDRLSDR